MSVADSEVAAEEQRLALGDLVLGEVVGDPVVQPRVVDADRRGGCPSG